VVLPSPDALDEDGWSSAIDIIESALAPRPPGVKTQLRLFLRLVNLLPVFSTGRTFVSLPPERRASYLAKLHRSPFMPFRRGLWGIRTLLFMGYYNQEQVRKEIGYGADPWGWTAHYGDELEEERAAAERAGGGEVDEAGGALNGLGGTQEEEVDE
jgi:hypothetical protein